MRDFFLFALIVLFTIRQITSILGTFTKIFRRVWQIQLYSARIKAKK